MSEPKDTPLPADRITVAGVSFTAAQVETVTVKIDGRTITISAPEKPSREIGFTK